MDGAVEGLVAEGRAALRRGDPAAARAAFGAAAELDAAGPVLAGLAEAAYLEQDFDAAIDGFERAYATFRASGDHPGSARLAGTLAFLHGMVRGDRAVMSGWLSRAQTILDGAEETTAAGWVELFRGMFAGGAGEREGHFRAALALARRHGAFDLELDALAYLGATLVHADRVDEGMVHLDEALAGVAGQEVDDFLVLSDVFCQLFSACEHAHDVGRADEWIRVGESIAARRALPDVSGWCRTHYGGVLAAAGRWTEAEVALADAVRLWSVRPTRLRLGAVVRLAGLRVRQTRLEEAEVLLAELEADAPEVALVAAALHHARGAHELAMDLLERASAAVDPCGFEAAAIHGLLVDVHLAREDVPAAADAVDLLQACAERHPRAHVVAAAALARGRLCLASGDGDTVGCLRAAVAEYARAHLPFEAAVARLELARVLLVDRPEVATAEARAAFATFERLEARSHADAASALLRTLGARVPTPRPTGDVLTKREAEVLDLLGLGLTNPEISARLYISRKTVEHHVGNVLAKLGLRNRGEAAAYAARHRSP